MEEDLVVLALTLFRECRGEPKEGQIAVANVIANRVKRNHSSYYLECTKPLQFSSMTSRGDSQLVVWPSLSDLVYMQCRNIAFAAINTEVPDNTNGSTLYYAPSSIQAAKDFTLSDGTIIPFPKTWNPQKVEFETKIGKHVFMREV